MQLRGIATGLYGTQRKSIVSVTTLTSESADRIFIEGTQKVEIDPFDAEQARQAFMPVLDKICEQPAQMCDVPQGRAQIPMAVVYGTPEKHPAVVYKSMIRAAFPEYFPKNRQCNATVAELLKHLFLTHYAEHGQDRDALIELNDYYLFPSHEDGSLKTPLFTEDQLSGLLGSLHEVAESGNGAGRTMLEHYAKEAARIYNDELQGRCILTPRFVQYGPRNGSRQGINKYTTLGLYNLKDVFVRALLGYAAEDQQHNICVKTPNDAPSPPFTDICATHIADQWDIFECHQGNRPQKRHVFASYPD